MTPEGVASPPRPTDSGHAPGLSSDEAASRRQRYGDNEIPAGRPRSRVRVALDALREPMFLLLLASGLIYLVLGDRTEAVALLAAVFLIIVITIYQEQKTEHALQALRDLSSPRALVIRDGALQRIPGREVVPGDLVVLREGDRVPADAILESATNLLVDESLLTGESLPVRKTPAAGPVPTAAPGGDDLPFAWSGTWIVRGEGRARVTATGSATALGRIGKSLAALDTGRTGLQQEVARVVTVLATLGLGACAAVAIAYGVREHGWLNGALAGLTLAISMVPEEFPVILTVFLALGAWRIARHRVLTRRLPAIEALGAATVLCVDKTGTLTLNRMTVAAAAAGDDLQEIPPGARHLPGPFADLIRTAIRASRPQAFDPTERAFLDLGRALDLADPERGADGFVREYPLSSRRLAVTHAWRREEAPDMHDIAAKGAPEAMLDLAASSGEDRQRVLAQVETMAGRGLRVLGVAHAEWHGALPDSPSAFAFTFDGLVGLADPVRAGVPAAIDECRSAGIRVVMMTGDYPGTAVNVARQIGLARPGACLTGSAMAEMSDAVLRETIGQYDVFARMVPEQKLRLVTALRAQGDVVAMTGDGVNDGPALKAANIGIAMGERGTDVAREAAAMVLVDDDFSSIVRAVRLGRRIYDNIRKATAYVLAVHVPIAGISLIPAVLGWPLLLMPVHVIFMEFITDPACSVAFEMEPDEADLMRRPPRRATDRLFTRGLVLRSLLQGTGALVAALAVLLWSRATGLTDAEARTVTFSTLVVTNLALIAANRSLRGPRWRDKRARNPATLALAAAALGVLAAIVSIPWCRSLFRVAPLHGPDLLVVAVAGLGAFVWMEAVKRSTGRASGVVDA